MCCFNFFGSIVSEENSVLPFSPLWNFSGPFQDLVFIFDFQQFFFVCLFDFLINLFIYFLAELGLRCCVQAFSSCSERELLFVVERGLLIVVAFLVAKHGL